MRTHVTKVYFILLAVCALNVQAETASVEVVYPQAQNTNLELSFSGNVEALNDAQLTTLESGIVNQLLVEAGDQVVKGQALLTLDDALATIQLEQAKAEYQGAMVKYQEDLRLYNEIVGLTKQKVTAKTLLAERKSNLANSEALMAQVKSKVKLQQEILNRHTLVAPFSGIISARNVDVGEWITPQNKILRLVSDQTLRIFVDVPQEYFQQMSFTSDIPATVLPDTLSGKQMDLSVSKFIKVSNPNSRTFKARIDLPDNTTLVAGMSAIVKLTLPNQITSQVNVPKTALKRHPDGSYSVFSVQQNKIKRLSIKLISSSFDQVLVQGVPSDVPIVLSGVERLKEGLSVTITESKESN